MARGDRREEIFRDDRDRGKFLGYLAEGAERFRVKVHCYVLTENHFHLVATTPAALFRMPSSISVAETIRRTKAHDAQTLKGLKNQISHK
jgi:REP element-mobilizing transposase RayT